MEAIYYITGFFLIPVILGLIVGTIVLMVKPHLINDRKAVKKPFSRRKILLVGMLAIVFSFVGFGSVIAVTEPASVKEIRVLREAEEASLKNKTAEDTSEVPVVKVEAQSKVEEVPFETAEEQTASLAKGVTQVKTEGVAGERTIVYEVTLTDGVETKRTVLSDEITKQPVTKVVQIGTYVAPAPKKESKPAAKPASSCNPNYSGCVPNVSYDLDCADIGYTVQVLGYDQYRLDGRDNDGWGCESY